MAMNNSAPSTQHSALQHSALSTQHSALSTFPDCSGPLLRGAFAFWRSGRDALRVFEAAHDRSSGLPAGRLGSADRWRHLPGSRRQHVALPLSPSAGYLARAVGRRTRRDGTNWAIAVRSVRGIVVQVQHSLPLVGRPLAGIALERTSSDPAVRSMPRGCWRWWALRMLPVLVCLLPVGHTLMRRPGKFTASGALVRYARRSDSRPAHTGRFVAGRSHLPEDHSGIPACFPTVATQWALADGLCAGTRYRPGGYSFIGLRATANVGLRRGMDQRSSAAGDGYGRRPVPGQGVDRHDSDR